MNLSVIRWSIDCRLINWFIFHIYIDTKMDDNCAEIKVEKDSDKWVWVFDIPSANIYLLEFFQSTGKIFIHMLVVPLVPQQTIHIRVTIKVWPNFLMQTWITPKNAQSINIFVYFGYPRDEEYRLSSIFHFYDVFTLNFKHLEISIIIQRLELNQIQIQMSFSI